MISYGALFGQKLDVMHIELQAALPYLLYVGLSCFSEPGALMFWTWPMDSMLEYSASTLAALVWPQRVATTAPLPKFR